MDLDLSSLFSESCSPDNPPTNPSQATQKTKLHEAESDNLDEILGDVQTMLDGKMSGLVDDHIAKLTKERDEWKSQAEAHALRIALLEKRLAAKLASTQPLDPDVLARLRHVELENRRLESKSKSQEDEIHQLKNTRALLTDHNSGQSRKLRGAHKKVKNAKDVALSEKEKAEDAIHERNLRLKSEKNMRRELKEEKARVADCEKMIAKLRAGLHAEIVGTPHLRDDEEEDGTPGDEASVAFSVQFRIQREHFQKVRDGLEFHRIGVTDKLVAWYERWKKPREEEAGNMVVGADYVNSKKNGSRMDDDRDGDDAFEVREEYPRTGAEHDGWRSRRALENVCRQAMEAHGSRLS